MKKGELPMQGGITLVMKGPLRRGGGVNILYIRKNGREGKRHL